MGGRRALTRVRPQSCGFRDKVRHTELGETHRGVSSTPAEMPMLKRLGFPEAIFSINSFVAAMLALYIAFSIGLPRPYWAMLTVYITVQPLSGALRSKAVYRVLGTILGGVAAVVLVPNLVNSPAVLSVALASWVGFCLYISLLDRTPRSYMFLLAGYTAAIIGFPSVDAPQTIFDTALNRVEE